MKAIMAKKTAALWAVMGLTAVLGVFVAVVVAKPAHADSGTASSTVTAVVFKSVNLKGALVVTDEHIKVGKEHGCTKLKTFKNSSNVVGHKYHGSKRVGYIDHNGLLCRDKHSPTGWVKRGGGKTGRDCRNIAAPMNVKMPFPMVKHVIDIKMVIKVFATVTASAEVHESCGSASGSGSASDWITITISQYIRSESNVGLREKFAASVVVKAKDKAVANAAVTCNTTTTPTTVTTQTTTTTTTTTPPPQTFTMVFDTINDIPGGTCRPETLHVTTSVAGSIQISPTNGLISTVDCYQPDTGQKSMVTPPVGTGSTDVVVYVYESNDTTITSDTLTAVPIISGVDAKSNTVTTTFTVSHPIRP